MKLKIILYLLPLLFLLTLSPALAEAPDITAESAILIDAHSGRVLYAKDEHQRRPMASTTKITTALIALEKGKLTDVVTASKHAEETGESSIELMEGQKITLENLLYAMMLPSANDAAVAIAEHVGGTEENFIGLMNRRVQDLGLTDTHYVTPNGLHNPDHFSSAYDMAFIAREALKIPKFREIIATERRDIPWEGHPWLRVLNNKNKLLYRYPFAIGVKNGYTRQAGNCLVGAAEKDGLTLIAVVLKSKHMYEETQQILEYGFANYQPLKVVSRGELIRKVDVVNGTKKQVQVVSSQDVIVAVNPEEVKNINKKVALVNFLSAPVKVGSRAGVMEILLNDTLFEKVDLLTSEGAEQPWTFMMTLKETVFFFLKLLT